jgi:hypothetical protein
MKTTIQQVSPVISQTTELTMHRVTTTAFGLTFLLLVVNAGALQAEDVRVDFDRDIQGILSDNCFRCHGPNEKDRQGELRLDVPDGLFAKRDDRRPVVPGKPGNSELFRRITADDELERMPPPDSGKTLTADEIALIKRWIEQGAEWKGHWAYVSLKRPHAPSIAPSGFVRNDIDRFVLARLRQKTWKPAAAADCVTLIRRLSFDLVGLPPTPAEVERFLADKSPNAYEKLVDRILKSPHFGERMALYWLDQVRYADTAGYHSDNHRDVWLYRDYVINAFNENMPFDRFTVEQLAGDLLPSPTRWQRTASGYNRLIKTTEEGGAQAKEYQAKYDADRARNIAEVWMAATMGCSQCHNHKFDPYTMKDFYSLISVFSDIQERPVGRQPQTPVPTDEQQAKLHKLDAQVADLRKVFNAPTPALVRSLARWEDSWQIVVAPVPGEKPAAGSGKQSQPPKDILEILSIPPKGRTAPQQTKLVVWYRGIAPELRSTRDQLARLQRQKQQFQKTIPTTLVSTSGKRRTIRILPRGNWQDDSGPVMNPAAPEFLPPMKIKRGDGTRLDFARWLTSRENPLTARVFVNRLWKVAFGQGLVGTLDDFGVQGDVPTHPRLLDWLAVEFIDSGWNVKQMLKLMVMSGTYRQSSAADAKTRQRDPDNKWLARQNRFRLDAEIVRDNSLAVSGLLFPKIGGPSVKPYQPAGYWMHLNFPKRKWVADTGENQYRRGLYTYWQRTFLHPSLLAFDAPSREECTAKRPRSNNPLQALVLLNDPTYVEAARVFAERIVRDASESDYARLQLAYRICLSRDVQPAEAKLLLALVQKHRTQYAADAKAAEELLKVGQHAAPAGIDKAELAAWTSVTRVLLNLHETIMRR